MGLQNRDKAINEQVDNWDIQTSVTGVSSLIQLVNVPYVGQIQKIVATAYGLSGSPILGVQIQRFITGSGLTTIPLNGSSLLTVTAFSTSGLMTCTLPALSSSLVQVIPGDQVQFVTSGANTAASYAANVVIQCLQDFKTQYGLFSGN